MNRAHYTFFRWILTLLFLLHTPAFADTYNDPEGSINDNLSIHLYDDVDLASVLKLDDSQSRMIIKSVYPKLAGEDEKAGIDGFNQRAQDIVSDEISKFKAETATQQAKKKLTTASLIIDYDTSFLKSNNNHIISIRFSMKGAITGLGHAYRAHRVLNYNLDTNQPIELSDLFLSDSDYLNIISENASTQLSRYLKNKSLIAKGTAPDINNFANWNIKPNGLLITFETDTVAPRIQGTQTVLIPYSAISDDISPDSPLASCIHHQRRCTNTNLLTGGFIDEA